MRKIGVLLSCLALLLGLCSCGGNDSDAVTVQSVASITGGGYIGAYNRFAGIVSARSETVIKKDDDRIIDEIKVEAGDHVEKGQVLMRVIKSNICGSDVHMWEGKHIFKNH